jgi:hypothetical protein
MIIQGDGKGEFRDHDINNVISAFLSNPQYRESLRVIYHLPSSGMMHLTANPAC